MAIFSLSPVLINFKVAKYLKNYHHDFWIKYTHMGVGSIFGPTPFQAIKRLGGLDDPKIAAYEKEWNKAMRQFFLLFLALIIIFLLFSFVAFLLYKAKVI